MPEVVAVSEFLTDPDTRERALRLLRSGAVACFPTDTVYGLGGRADWDVTVKKLFDLKGRSEAVPIPVLLADGEDLSEYGVLGPRSGELMEKHWPGALTMVTLSLHRLSSHLSNSDTLGFRCPNVEWLREMIRGLGVPLAATSANVSGDPPILRLLDLPAEISERCDLLIDGGTLPQRLPSTVVDCTGPKPLILRQGEIRI